MRILLPLMVAATAIALVGCDRNDAADDRLIHDQDATVVVVPVPVEPAAPPAPEPVSPDMNNNVMELEPAPVSPHVHDNGMELEPAPVSPDMNDNGMGQQPAPDSSDMNGSDINGSDMNGSDMNQPVQPEAPYDMNDQNGLDNQNLSTNTQSNVPSSMADALNGRDPAIVEADAENAAANNSDSNNNLGANLSSD